MAGVSYAVKECLGCVWRVCVVYYLLVGDHECLCLLLGACIKCVHSAPRLGCSVFVLHTLLVLVIACVGRVCLLACHLRFLNALLL
jgi:hypothetical protein